MKQFDCLSPECILFGPHLLEASAGTGKTFSIEHIFLRILLESKAPQIQLEEILSMTFTRAATRELKERIRSNLETALAFLRSEKENPWPYLKPLIGSASAIQILSDTLSLFDRCQIFTIHGFCYRILKEFAFEANQGFFLSDPEGENPMSKKVRRSLNDFFQKGVEPDLCPEQISLLLGKFDSMEEIGRCLIRSQRKKSDSLEDLYHRYKTALKSWQGKTISRDLLIEDFAKVRIHYKTQIKGDFERQIEWLAKSFQTDDWIPFRTLILDRGTLFDFLHPSNKKIRAGKVDSLHYPGFFDWAISHLHPILSDASDKKKILATLVNAWKRWEELHLSEKDLLQPDEILIRMRKAIESDSFAARIRQKFKAVIIDEFQDTDPLQWEIFCKLFLNSSQPSPTFYLVGDPKQSIYRFRNADVYTYFSARDYLGEEHLYLLDTNYRSSKELIGSLNAIFDRPWLPLPKTKGTIPYFPVRAGSSIQSDFSDARQALHWIIGEEKAMYRDTFLPFAVREIELLRPSSFSSIAILVKDRYEAENALDLLRMRGIPAIARSHQAIGKTIAFQSLRELLEAIASPYDESRIRIVQLGPFAMKEGEFFPAWKALLEEKGLVFFFTRFLQDRLIFFEADLKQILEELFFWERREGFSFEGLKRFLDDFEKREADEGGRRRMEEAKDAVQVMTLHISKGLEFEVVFALGLTSKPSENEEETEEIDAEKLRQLYVAMTRAKKRLYVPVKKSSSKGSPMDLFCQNIEGNEGPFLSFLQKLSEKESISFEEIATPFLLPSKQIEQTKNSFVPPIPLPKVFYPPLYLYSFTSLAKPKKLQPEKNSRELSSEFTLETLPRGTETGIIVHQIFEKLFTFSQPIWRNAEEIDCLVEKELKGSSLSPWIVPIQEMVRQAMIQPLSDGKTALTLSELKPDQLFAEMEFLYAKETCFVKGSIDLAFCYQGKYYLLDWKTNWLKDSSPQTIQEVMKSHDYELQATLYSEALRRHLSRSDDFGGAFYLFVRTGGYYYIEPDKLIGESCGS